MLYHPGAVENPKSDRRFTMSKVATRRKSVQRTKARCRNVEIYAIETIHRGKSGIFDAMHDGERARQLVEQLTKAFRGTTSRAILHTTSVRIGGVL
jgi:predicted kinase